jgi:hypothetical protein
VQRSFGAMAGSLTRLSVVAAGLGTGAAFGLAAMVRGAADTAGELDDLSKRLGISTRELQGFRFAAVMSGQSSETFTAAISRLHRNMGMAAAGRNQELSGMFRHLGINLRHTNGQIRSATEILPHLAQALQRNENTTVRNRLATIAFGRSGQELLPMFTDGAEGLARLTEMFRRYGHAFSPEEVERGASFGDTMDTLTTALRGTADAIGMQLIPVVKPLLEGLRDWIRANRELITAKVGEWAQAAAEWIGRIDFGAVRDSLSEFLGVARQVFDAIGGWKGVIIGVAAVITGPLMLAIGTLTAALLANPIGAAVAVIAGAAFLIYQNWDGIVEFFRGLWASVTSIFEGAWEVIGPIVRMIVRGAEALGAITGGAGANPAFSPEAQQDRRQAFGARGGAGGFYGGPALDPDTGEPAFPNALPRLYQPQSAPGGAAAAAPQGEVRVRMSFENVPRGARVDAEASGRGVQRPDLDVGYATMGAF